MVKIKNQDKSDVQILVSGLIILTICMVACVLHVSDLYDSFRKRVQNDFNNQIRISSNLINTAMSQTDEYLNSFLDTLYANSQYPSGKDISLQLNELKRKDDLAEVYFFKDNGMSYDQTGLTNQESTRSLYQLVSQQKDSIILFQEPFSKEEYLIFIKPYEESPGIYSYVVGFKSYQKLVDGDFFSYWKENGACYIINNAGDIIIRKEDKIIPVGESDNFYSGILNCSDKTDTTKTKLNQLKYSLNKFESKSISFINDKGTRSNLYGYNLESAKNIYFVGYIVEDILLVDAKPTILRSVLTCIVIILLMISLIIYVWGSAKQANITIEKLAYQDQVTGGMNGNYFRDKALQIMANNRETPFIAQRFDIVNFRYLNEAYGHNRADEVLKACISISRQFFSEKELCVRMDSDQFLMLNVNDTRVDQKRASYIEALNEYTRSIGIKYPIRLKCGVYQVRKQDLDIDVIIDRANVARKSLDGDENKTIAYYSDSLVRDMRKVDKIESDMNKAINAEEFKIYLQPKWNIVKNELAGAEALVRWVKPDDTIIYPNQFIPIFEKNGFIEKLDFYMLESVCKKMSDLKKKNIPIFPISVNQSRLLLHNPEYIKNITKILKKYDIPREYVELELTETVFFDDREKMIEIMKELKGLHIKLSMDDFGSGYSSLNMLKDIPFDILKIDREFFGESITSESSTWILQKVIEMAYGLGIDVICEGVETQDQVNILKQIGCYLVQGYFYSRPIPMEEFIEKYCGNKV